MNKLIALLFVVLISFSIIKISLARDIGIGPLGWDDIHPGERRVVVKTTVDATPQPTSSMIPVEK